MKRILLPTDFSDNAWNAIFTALKLYANMECQFYLLHAYEPKSINLLGRKSQKRLGFIYDSLSQSSEKELKKILAYLHENHKNAKHTFESISTASSLEEAVVNSTINSDIDMIIMGTQGATGAKEIFLGSNTVKVLKKINKLPIIVVPEAYNFQKLKKVIFPTDYIKSYEKFALHPLIELVTLWKSKLHILHITSENVLNATQQTNKKILQERLFSLQNSFENVAFNSNIAHSLEKYLVDNETQLMAIIRHHHSFWEKLIGEPVIKKVAFHTSVPVLMLPED
ncbi:universal stress protein UspA [Croceivirga lutea]|uniref:universal stress protein n=1 Tax=Croceivirga lutea TaxID=1775167 RepID=UPI00163B58CE|nr:universal stress protein [Croceivirga lutea]GGG43122.1 universal stress protein UspA [Croceivirga lutea]